MNRLRLDSMVVWDRMGESSVKEQELTCNRNIFAHRFGNNIGNPVLLFCMLLSATEAVCNCILQDKALIATGEENQIQACQPSRRESGLSPWAKLFIPY